MKNVLFALFLGFPILCFADGSALAKILAEAWRTAPAVAQIEAQWRAAYWDRQTFDRSWIPALSLDSNQLNIPAATEHGAVLNNTFGITGTQKLPGGGKLLLGMNESLTRTWSKDHGFVGATDRVPTFSLQLDIPFVQDYRWEAAETSFELADVQRRVALRTTFYDFLRTAAELDIARESLSYRQAVELAALEASKESDVLVLQGRTAASEGWRIQRAARSAGWDTLQAQWDLGAASDAWDQVSSVPLPLINIDAVEALGTSGTSSDETPLSETIIVLQKKLELMTLAQSKMPLSPSLTIEATVASPVSAPRTYSGRVGLSLGTDLLIIGSAYDEKSKVLSKRWDSLAAQARGQEGHLLNQWRTQLAAFSSQKLRLNLEYRRVQEIRDSVVQLGQRQGIAKSEVLAAEAEVLSVELERKKLAWKEITLLYKLEPPDWWSFTSSP